MEELSHILGFIFMIFTIVLKATVSNTNSLSFSSFSLGGNNLFSLDTIWRSNVNSVNLYTVPVSSVLVSLPVIALPKCVPADYNSTLPDFTGYKSEIWIPAHDEICGQRVFLSSTKGDTVIARSRNLKHEELARLVKNVRQTVFNARAWARLARRVFDIVFSWDFAFSVTLGCIGEPKVLHALEEIRLALARLGRKGKNIVNIVSGRRRRTRRRKSLLHHRYRYYKTPYIAYPDHVLDDTEMPLVVHSYLGHGIMRDSWHDIITLVSPVDFQPAYVQLTEWWYEIRLPHCIDRCQPGAGSRKLDIQWTLRTRKRVCRRLDPTDDEWYIIDGTMTEVHQGEYMDTSFSAIEYYRLGREEI